MNALHKCVIAFSGIRTGEIHAQQLPIPTEFNAWLHESAVSFCANLDFICPSVQLRSLRQTSIENTSYTRNYSHSDSHWLPLGLYWITALFCIPFLRHVFRCWRKNETRVLRHCNSTVFWDVAASWTVGVQLPARTRDYSLLHSVQTECETNPASYPSGLQSRVRENILRCM